MIVLVAGTLGWVSLLAVIGYSAHKISTTTLGGGAGMWAIRSGLLVLTSLFLLAFAVGTSLIANSVVPVLAGGAVLGLAAGCLVAMTQPLG